MHLESKEVAHGCMEKLTLKNLHLNLLTMVLPTLFFGLALPGPITQKAKAFKDSRQIYSMSRFRPGIFILTLSSI